MICVTRLLAKNHFWAANIVFGVIFPWFYFRKNASNFYFWHCTDNDTHFMNPWSRLPLSVNQQERWSLQRGARSRLCLKIVQWQSQPFLSLLESDEQQACWMKNFYYLETIFWVQGDGTSASRGHATESWGWNIQSKISLSDNPLTNIQAWWVETRLLWSEVSSRAGECCQSSLGQNSP